MAISLMSRGPLLPGPPWGASPAARPPCPHPGGPSRDREALVPTVQVWSGRATPPRQRGVGGPAAGEEEEPRGQAARWPAARRGPALSVTSRQTAAPAPGSRRLPGL